MALDTGKKRDKRGTNEAIGQGVATMAKTRIAVYLDPPTAEALGGWQHRHRHQCRSLSEAGQHLLRRALLTEVDEGLEGLLVPLLERRVAEAAERAVREEVATLLRAQTDRLAALLVRSGKDARTATALAVAVLEQLTGDRTLARRLAGEARLAAGSAYSAVGLRASGEG